MLGKRLRQVRMRMGYTQQVLADKVIVSLRTYQKYEQGVRYPSYDVLIALSNELDVSIDWLLGRDEWLQSHGVSFGEYQ